jgi:DNA-binding SARP family transcriptional activator/TolB-like protein
MPFRLRTLGRLALADEAGHDDPSLSTRPRKLALLTWLASRPERRASRDRLIGIFWGGRDDERARNSLSDALSHLRRILGRDAIRSQGEEIIITGDAPLVIDAVELVSAVRAGDYARVTALYGGPFLDGFYIDDAPEFDDWRDRECRRLANLFAQSAAARCLEFAKEKSWDACRDLSERWLDAQPASADAAVSLLRAIAAPETHAALAAAMFSFRTLVRRLDTEFGIAPDPAVTAFAAELSARLAATPKPTIPAEPVRAEEPVVERSAPDVATPQGRVGRTAKIAGIAVAVVAIASLLAARYIARPLDRRHVVVASLRNETGDTALARLGDIAAHWITHALSETRAVAVLDPAIGANVATDPRVLGREVGAGVVVVGSFARRGDSIVFDARIVDATSGRVLRAVPGVVSSGTDPLEGVSLLLQRVAGAMAAEIDPLIGAVAREASQPPTYGAYQAWVEGLDRFAHRRYGDAVPYFLRAAESDSNFVSPRIWAAAAYGNAGDYALCDSLLRAIRPLRDRLAPLDRGLADMWWAVLDGNLPAQYAAGTAMLKAAPNSELSLYVAGIKAMEVNRPEEAVRLLGQIPAERSGVSWDVYGTRLGDALHLAARYRDELIEANRRRARAPTSLYAARDQGRALIALGRLDDFDVLTREIGAMPPDSVTSVGAVLYYLGQELVAHDHSREASRVFGQVVEWARTRSAKDATSFSVRSLLVRSLYQAGRGEAADSLLRAFLVERPSDLTYLSTHALIAAQRGDTATADSVSALLASRDLPPYDRHNFTSARGRIAAILGRRVDAIRLLQQARDEGWPILNLHLSTEMRSLRADAAFEALIRPRSE